MAGCLLCTNATAEQHCLFSEGQWRVATLVDCPSQRHCNEEWRRIVGHLLERLQCRFEPCACDVIFAATQCEDTGEVLHRSSNPRQPRGDAKCLVALPLRQVPVSGHEC